MAETPFDAVLFDFSGTLFRLEEDESWLADVTDHEGRPFDVHRQAELMRRLTQPVGQPVEMDATSTTRGPTATANRAGTARPT